MMQTQRLTSNKVLPRISQYIPDTTNKPLYDIALSGIFTADRKDNEQFVKAGFVRAYDAHIDVNMPYLLSLKQQERQATLGFRDGSSPLFIECYLQQPIEQHDYFNTQQVIREDIVEVGHLFSNSQQLTLPLFALTALFLKSLGYKYFVFSGTQRVIQIIERSGVKFTFLSEAKKEHLTGSQGDWGNYYKTHPKVVALQLDVAIETIKSLPYFTPYIKHLNNGAHSILKQFLSQQPHITFDNSIEV